jgi:molecular chaperone DnaK
MNIIGIDLGTTFSAIASLNKVGEPEIIPNDESERITPSVVLFEEKGKKPIVGTYALRQKAISENKIARFFKRDMNEEYYENKIWGEYWRASDLSSYVLNKIREDFEKVKGKIDYGVITVPAYFDDTGRKATVKAGKKVGLEIVGIINEPTAAAIYYSKNHDIRGKNLVFDLGGGTFDVTVLESKDEDIDIISSLGDHRLGGYDFDLELINLIYERNIEKLNRNTIEDLKKDSYILEEVENIKKNLSVKEKAEGKIIFGNQVIDYIITRNEFEAIISRYIARMEMLIESVLEEANLKESEIDNVILVGGSTRIPAVRKMIVKKFKKEPLNVGNVDECVALGAAIYCGYALNKDNPSLLNDTMKMNYQNMDLKEICNHSYGTSVVTIDYETNDYTIKNDIIIPKNTKIPVTVTKEYATSYEDQNRINIKVTQGEGEDIDMVNILKEETMNVPGNRPAGRPIQVEYRYDRNQMMRCRFIDKESGIKKEIKIEINSDEEDLNKLFDLN